MAGHIDTLVDRGAQWHKATTAKSECLDQSRAARMAYRFKLDDTLGRGFRRIVRDEVGKARSALALAGESGADIGRAVHETRRSLKRLRSLLRLVRSEIGSNTFRKQNGALRHIARRLSMARDVRVAIATLGDLEAEGGVGAADAASASGRLSSIAAEHGDPIDDATLKAADKALEQVGRRLQRIEWKRGSPASASGLTVSCKALRDACAAAYAEPTDDRFHDLRKAAQDYARHLQLLASAWPAAIAPRAEAARQVSEALGNDHDLCVLDELLRAATKRPGRDRCVAAVSSACRAKREALRITVRPILHRLIAGDGRDEAAVLAQWWRASRQLPLEVTLDKRPRRIGVADETHGGNGTSTRRRPTSQS